MHEKKKSSLAEESVLTPTYASREMTSSIPKHEFPEQSTAPATVYNLIHDELILDGNSRQNLATFVTTWMVHIRTHHEHPFLSIVNTYSYQT